MSRFVSAWCLVAAAVVSACAVGPDFEKPKAIPVQRYTADLQPDVTAVADGITQRYDGLKTIPAQWWRLFENKELNELIQVGLENSPSLSQAEARLKQAQEQYRAQFGATMLPNLNAAISGERQKIDPRAFGVPDVGGSPFTIYNSSISVSYMLDLFGKNRRALEALQASIDYQRFLLRAAQLTLSANIVTAVIQEASLRDQIAITRKLITLQEVQLVISEERYRVGAVSQLDISSQRSRLAQLEASLPPLQLKLQQIRHLLAVYVGKAPGESDLPLFTLDSLHLPVSLPMTLPSELARQRPDIQAAEALLHKASAEVGVATANLYPQLSLSASWGASSTSGLWGSTVGVWDVAAGLTAPIFHGGELQAKKREAVAAYEEALGAYKDTVLHGLQDVADVMQAIDKHTQTLALLNEATLQARRRYEIALEQYRAGGVSYLALLDSEREYQQALLGETDMRANRYADTASLFQALGGGWWNDMPDGN